jgi:hypothetical protein
MASHPPPPQKKKPPILLLTQNLSGETKGIMSIAIDDVVDIGKVICKFVCVT